MEDKKLAKEKLKQEKKEEKRKIKENKKQQKESIKNAKPKLNREAKTKRLVTILIAVILLLAMVVPSVIGIVEYVRGANA